MSDRLCASSAAPKDAVARAIVDTMSGRPFDRSRSTNVPIRPTRSTTTRCASDWAATKAAIPSANAANLQGPRPSRLSSPMPPTVIRFGGGCASATRNSPTFRGSTLDSRPSRCEDPALGDRLGPSSKERNGVFASSRRQHEHPVVVTGRIVRRWAEVAPSRVREGRPLRERVVPRGRVVPLCVDLTLQPGESTVMVLPVGRYAMASLPSGVLAAVT